MKKPALRKLDLVDKASLPLFAVTMLAEYAALRKVPKRTLGDLDNADELTLSGTHMPPDPLVPLGYERKDTVASLAMLAGNIAFGFATLSAFSRVDRFLFKHRVANVGMRRGSIAFAAVMSLWVASFRAALLCSATTRTAIRIPPLL